MVRDPAWRNGLNGVLEDVQERMNSMKKLLAAVLISVAVGYWFLYQLGKEIYYYG